MKARVLSEQDHQHYLEHGYVVVRNVVDPATIDEVVQALQGSAHSGTVGMPDFQWKHQAAVERCSTPRFNAAIAELLGEENVPTRWPGDCMPRVQEPDAQWNEPKAHVDDDYPTAMPGGWVVGTFLFLTEVKLQGGGYYYFAGSPRRYRELLGRTPRSLKFRASEPELSGEGRELLAQPGDLLLFHHNFGHSGTTNVSDPVTRQALLARHSPAQRLRPGKKPFESMTTAEKSNSARFLRERWGDDVVVLEVGHTAEANETLRHGFGCGAPLATFVTIVHEASVHLLAVTGDRPTEIRQFSSANWVEWHEQAALRLVDFPITHLQWHQHGKQLHLLVSGDRGTSLFTGDDLINWAELGTRPEVGLVVGQYCSTFGSRLASGQFLLETTTGQPGAVQCRWGKSWEAVLSGEVAGSAPVLALTDGSRIVDLEAQPVLGEQSFALVLDTVEPGASHSTPQFIRANDAANFNTPAQPLRFDCPGVPRSIRVCLRAREYWLVAFSLRGSDSIFWGEIDWAEQEPTLRHLDDTAKLEAAFAMTGLI